MMGEKADLVITDPPYGISYESKAGKIENDDLKPNALLEFLTAAFSVMEYALKPGACWYCWHADGGELGKVFRDAIAAHKTLLNKATLI
jgi:site-specific DNA-methyltransferase (adenine-specific)